MHPTSRLAELGWLASGKKPGASNLIHRVGRLVPKKGYIGTVSTKTHSGDPDGTGGFGGFLGSGRSLALKFGFYATFHRENRLEIVGKL